jgi:hypothetical protein
VEPAAPLPPIGRERLKSKRRQQSITQLVDVRTLAFDRSIMSRMPAPAASTSGSASSHGLQRLVCRPRMTSRRLAVRSKAISFGFATALTQAASASTPSYVPSELGWRTDFGNVYMRGKLIGAGSFGQVSAGEPSISSEGAPIAAQKGPQCSWFGVVAACLTHCSSICCRSTSASIRRGEASWLGASHLSSRLAIHTCKAEPHSACLPCYLLARSGLEVAIKTLPGREGGKRALAFVEDRRHLPLQRVAAHHHGPQLTPAAASIPMHSCGGSSPGKRHSRRSRGRPTCWRGCRAARASFASSSALKTRILCRL